MKKELIKTCARCNEKKPVAQFNKQQKNPDGLQAYCKACGIDYKEEKRQMQKDKDKKIFNPNTLAF